MIKIRKKNMIHVMMMILKIQVGNIIPKLMNAMGAKMI